MFENVDSAQAQSCILLAEALSESEEHAEEALVFYQEALVRHQSLKSTDDVLKCLLYMVRSYRSLKVFEKVIETFVEISSNCRPTFINYFLGRLLETLKIR